MTIPAPGRGANPFDSAGVRIGYLFRKLAAEYAALIDHGLVQLRGRLLAPGERVRIDTLLARSA